MSLPFEKKKLEECAKEQIHLLGKVQSHGVLFVLSPGNLEILSVSANAGGILGVEPSRLCGTSLEKWIGEATIAQLKLASKERAYTFNNPLTVHFAGGLIFDGIAHLSGEQLIFEIECRDAADISASEGIDDYFRLTNTTLQRVTPEDSVEQLAQKVAEDVKDFTGFDRVMVYRFAPDWHGEIIAEAREDELEPFLHLHYPASDIPPQARELYRKNWLRIVRDVTDEGTPIEMPDQQPLDLSMSTLRTMSWAHLKYLQNMGVKATMTISLLTPAGDLWGLIACHHYAGPYFLPYKARSACSNYALVVSTRITDRERSISVMRASRRERELPAALRELFKGQDLQEQIIRNASRFLHVLRADGLVIIENAWIETAGSTPSQESIAHIVENIRSSGSRDFVRSYDSLTDLELTDSGELGKSAGMLVIEVTPAWLVLAFRDEFVEEVKWGGDPNAPVEMLSNGRLTPRGSFSAFAQTVRGKCRSWTKTDRMIGAEFRTALSSFVIQRNEQLTALNSELASKNTEIEQFVYSISHDLKSPLVTIGGYIQALKEDLEVGEIDELRHSISRIDNAAERMNRLIEDLLAFSRIGRDDGTPCIIDMREFLQEISDDFLTNTKDIELKLPDNPRDILGAPRAIQRAFENLLNNAAKHARRNDGEPLSIWVGCQLSKKHIVYTITDNGCGIPPEFHERVFQLFERLNPKVKGTGVGLASVTKVMEQHGGTVKLESSDGDGCTFSLFFPRSF